MPAITTSHPSVAIIYDRVNTSFGGAEHVLESLHHIFPDAPIFTSVLNRQQAQWAKDMTVETSFVQQLPGATSHHRQYVWLMPLAFELLNLDAFDIVISVTSAEAKGVLTKPHQLHICYMLTPTRYLWSHTQDYQQNSIIELVKAPIFAYLRWWDSAAALRPDVIIPISTVVAKRCQRYYHRETSKVIYPPVELDKVEGSEVMPTALVHAGFQTGKYYLTVARCVRYKRIDLAIKACAQNNKDLVIIGDGPDHADLEQLAAKQHTSAKCLFLPAVQSSDLGAYYKNSRAFLAPAEEDFGIAVLESHLFGKPAILHQNSGAAEISGDGLSSVHIGNQSVEAITTAMQTLEATTWDPARIRAQVAPCRRKTFEKVFSDQVQTLWKHFTNS